jgi:hypothetical protein
MPSSNRRLIDGNPAETVWHEWLSIYLDHCSRALRPEQLRELSSVLPQAVADPVLVPRLISEGTAAEGRFLIDFLAGVAQPTRRATLITETVSRLQMVAAHPSGSARSKLLITTR